MIFRYLKESNRFSFTADGERHNLALEKILYLESMENYVRIKTPQKAYLVRFTLKEAEQLLANPHFIRNSRSHIINTGHINSIEQDAVKVAGQSLKIGKVYKKFFEDQLASRNMIKNS